jgi:hypothetical protein
VEESAKKKPRLAPGRGYLVNDRRKNSASPQESASAKAKPGARSNADESLWSEYLGKASRTQSQLSTAQAQIGYLTQGIVRWLLDNPAAKENVHVFALQERLAELHSIITRRAKRNYSTEDGPQWGATLARVRSLLKKTNIPGEELADQLPKELPGTAPEPAQLMDRERRIWDVIQRGASGPQYCRELDNAGIAPPRKGIWREGPRRYEAAYKSGEPWRHWIQNEKYKIRRKAELAGLASE